MVLYDLTGYPYYGSQTAAPLFRNIALDIIRYLDIAPSVRHDDGDKADRLLIVELSGMEIIEAENLLRKEGFDVKIVGKNNIIQK